MLKKKLNATFFLQKPNLVFYYSFITNLYLLFGKRIEKICISNNQLKIYLNVSDLFFFLYFIKKNSYFCFTQLIEIITEDVLASPFRFQLRYEVLSIFFNVRFSVIVKIIENTFVPSVVKLYPNAGWLEREIWDLFGVFFYKNPDLRRILTDYGFKGHPLRKDFPLSGFVEIFYDDSLKKLDYVPLSLSQDYRDFKFFNPWLKH